MLASSIGCVSLSQSQPPNLCKWLLLKNHGISFENFPRIQPESEPQRLIAVFSRLLPLPVEQDRLQAHYESIVTQMVELRITEESLARLPFGVQLPIRQMLSICRPSPPRTWPAEAYCLVGREDLAAQVNNPSIQIKPILAPSKTMSDTAREYAITEASSEDNSSLLRNPVCAIRFGKDHRLVEVQRLLDSSIPCRLRLPEVRIPNLFISSLS